MGIGLTEFCCSFNEASFFYIYIHWVVLISFNQCFNVLMFVISEHILQVSC